MIMYGIHFDQMNKFLRFKYSTGYETLSMVYANVLNPAVLHLLLYVQNIVHYVLLVRVG